MPVILHMLFFFFNVIYTEGCRNIWACFDDNSRCNESPFWRLIGKSHNTLDMISMVQIKTFGLNLHIYMLTKKAGYTWERFCCPPEGNVNIYTGSRDDPRTTHKVWTKCMIIQGMSSAMCANTRPIKRDKPSMSWRICCVFVVHLSIFVCSSLENADWTCAESKLLLLFENYYYLFLACDCNSTRQRRRQEYTRGCTPMRQTLFGVEYTPSKTFNVWRSYNSVLCSCRRNRFHFCRVWSERNTDFMGCFLD